MSMPKAYDPKDGYKYQILTKAPNEREYEHLDYAVDNADLKYLLNEYALAYRGNGFTFRTIKLPRKYWKKGEFYNVAG